MNNLLPELSACPDANILISAIAFGGKPLEIVQRVLNREFHVVTGPSILSEAKRNLLGKLSLDPDQVDAFPNDYMEVSSVFVPQGKVEFIKHAADSLVLELALISGCDVLVTGDRKHLLPLSVAVSGNYHRTTINVSESPSSRWGSS